MIGISNPETQSSDAGKRHCHGPLLQEAATTQLSTGNAMQEVELTPVLVIRVGPAEDPLINTLAVIAAMGLFPAFHGSLNLKPSGSLRRKPTTKMQVYSSESFDDYSTTARCMQMFPRGDLDRQVRKEQTVSPVFGILYSSPSLTESLDRSKSAAKAGFQELVGIMISFKVPFYPVALHISYYVSISW